jgi:tetratricopeptide (TPR) repeat protein
VGAQQVAVDGINEAALESALREGKDDPNAASINIKDEEFFASDYQEEAFVDDTYAGEQRRPSKAKWFALSLLILAMIAGGGIIYYVKTSPYIGDGPPELQIDREALVKKPKKPAKDESTERAEMAYLSGKGGAKAPVAADGRDAARLGQTPDAGVVAQATKQGTLTPSPARPDAAPVTAAASPDSGAKQAEPGYEDLLKEGLGLLKKRKKRQAMKVFAKAVEVNPQGWEALQELALHHMEAGRMKKSFELAKLAVQANPKAPYAQLVMGSVLQERGKNAEAKQAYQIFIQECPTCRYVGDIRAVLKSM